MLLSRPGRFGWDPFAEMQRMQNEMNRAFAGVPRRAAEGFPLINLWVGEHSLVATAELPGVRQEDIDLTIREDTLAISGKRRPDLKDENAAWHRRERVYGDFARAIELPFRIDPDRVEARFANGVLEIELQRPEVDRPKKIAIKSA
jgi:HSP20 family protein